MFKTKKTQFAIRKLAKGAVAVLLSFGILAGPSAPIVSAASEAIQNEVTSDTTSVVEESVPVENNTADTLTTDNTEVSANYSENTDDSTTTTVQTDTDVSTQKKQIQKHLLILSNQFKQKKLKVLLQLKI